MFMTVRGNELDLCQWEPDSIYIRCVIKGNGRSCQGPTTLGMGQVTWHETKDCLIWISHLVSCQIVTKLRWKIILCKRNVIAYIQNFTSFWVNRFMFQTGQSNLKLTWNYSSHKYINCGKARIRSTNLLPLLIIYLERTYFPFWKEKTEHYSVYLYKLEF